MVEHIVCKSNALFLQASWVHSAKVELVRFFRHRCGFGVVDLSQVLEFGMLPVEVPLGDVDSTLLRCLSFHNFCPERNEISFAGIALVNPSVLDVKILQPA